MCVTTQNHKKITKNPYFRGSKSFKVIDVDILRGSSLVLVIIRRMSVPICNCFYARRDDISKITIF